MAGGMPLILACILLPVEEQIWLRASHPPPLAIPQLLPACIPSLPVTGILLPLQAQQPLESVIIIPLSSIFFLIQKPRVIILRLLPEAMPARMAALQLA